MNYLPPLPIHRSIARRLRLAVNEGAFGNCLPLFVMATSAIEGFLTLGPLAQTMQIAAAVLRRLVNQAQR